MIYLLSISWYAGTQFDSGGIFSEYPHPVPQSAAGVFCMQLMPVYENDPLG